MKRERVRRRGSWAWALVGALGIAALGGSPLPVAAADGASPEADKILRSTCAYLAGLEAFSMTADLDNEVITQQGQKVQFSSHGRMVIQRPDRFHFSRVGLFADVEYYFDGENVTLHGKRGNAYMQLDAPGSVDDAIRLVEMETGLDAPGADLLFSDPYSILSNGIVSGEYLGSGWVNGIECHHLAFREEKVDWQLWVQVGDTPLPLKYVITSKWQTGAPQYTVELRDWDVKPRIRRSEFDFKVPRGAQRLTTLPVNEMGALALPEED